MSLEEQNRSLISQIELLNEKNYELEKIRRDQTEKLEAHKKASLTEDQTTSVLQQLKNLEEKLDKAKKSKDFFKEQWSKAVREIHMLKIENQQAIECQIKSSKTELDNLEYVIWNSMFLASNYLIQNNMIFLFSVWKRFYMPTRQLLLMIEWL